MQGRKYFPSISSLLRSHICMWHRAYAKSRGQRPNKIKIKRTKPKKGYIV